MNRNDVIRPRNYYVAAVALVLVGLVLGLGLSVGLNMQRPSSAARATGSTATTTSVSSGPLESPFVPVVERALPAVVFIDVRKKAASSDGSDPQDEFMRRFFGDMPRRQMRIPTSGSGFIIDPEGHIMTNNHVVRDAADITVTLNDKRTFKAQVVGTDPETDVAVIKIDGSHLPVLPLGDSDQLRVGDWAIAIGNPLGELRGSVTVGIISAQGRTGLNIFGGTPNFQDFIQTDASINFGNSGGPLCNIHGEAIGINTAINTSSQGIGFAIPINLARHVADQLLAHGSVKRAWLGVQLAELTPEIADGFGLSDSQQGVLIQSVLKGTPAEKAGLRRNDVIVEFNGQPVSDLQKFRLKVADTPPGSKVQLTVLRDGKRMPATVTLTARTEEAVAQAGGAREEAPATESMAGLKVRELSADEKSDLGVTSGVLVTDVDEGSPAEDAGIQANDVIEEVAAKAVGSTAEFSRLLRQAKAAGKKNAVLLVHRGDATQYVALPLK